jgi:hypothetical protein
MWNRALSDSEVVCIYRQKIDTTMPGLVHYFPMDQGIAGGNNVSQWGLINAVNGNDGFLNNFTLTGPSSNFVAGTTQITEVYDTICRGSSVQLGTQTFASAGTYHVRLNATAGCDSLVRLHLSLDTVNTSITQSRDTLRALLTTADSYQWLNCNNGYSAVAGGQNSQYIATANGSYAVEITENGCKDTSTCAQVTTVSAPSIGLQKHLQYYPNPGSNQLFLHSTLQGSLHLSVYDMFGRLFYSTALQGSILEISTNDWPVGTYIIHAQHERGNARMKWQKH